MDFKVSVTQEYKPVTMMDSVTTVIGLDDGWYVKHTYMRPSDKSPEHDWLHLKDYWLHLKHDWLQSLSQFLYVQHSDKFQSETIFKILQTASKLAAPYEPDLIPGHTVNFEDWNNQNPKTLTIKDLEKKMWDIKDAEAKIKYLNPASEITLSTSDVDWGQWQESAIKKHKKNMADAQLSRASKSLPGVWNLAHYPCNCASNKVSSERVPVWNIIQHLNDNHQEWTRERIADWVDELQDKYGLNMEFQVDIEEPLEGINE